MEHCVFCKIIDKTEPAYIIYQNQHVTAFLDTHPVAEGHVLISPNKHIEKLNEINDKKISHALMEALVVVANRLVRAGLCTDYSIVQANGEAAEQSIEHLHFHIIPRFKNDDVHFKLDTNQAAALHENLNKVYLTLSKLSEEENFASEDKQGENTSEIIESPVSYELRGKKRGREEVAMELLREGFSINRIVKLTRLKREEIEEVRKYL